eukprot:3931949-Rhodomonas_salina.2
MRHFQSASSPPKFFPRNVTRVPPADGPWFSKSWPLLLTATSTLDSVPDAGEDRHCTISGDTQTAAVKGFETPPNLHDSTRDEKKYPPFTSTNVPPSAGPVDGSTE